MGCLSHICKVTVYILLYLVAEHTVLNDTTYYVIMSFVSYELVENSSTLTDAAVSVLITQSWSRCDFVVCYCTENCVTARVALHTGQPSVSLFKHKIFYKTQNGVVPTWLYQSYRVTTV